MQTDSWALEPLAPISDADFRNWSQLLEERSGIVLAEERRALLEVRLTARMRELGLHDYGDYFRLITQGVRGNVEWARLLDQLTIQETRFFRHPPSFALVRDWLQQRFAQWESSRRKPLAMWSLGCSSGEEAWSLAMTAAEALRELDEPLSRFSLTATDISQSALHKAREGRYSAVRLAGVPTELRERYFVSEAAGFQIIPQLRARLCFARLNALELEHSPLTGMNLVFCQNMLIYFRRWQRRSVLNQLVQCMAPGGLLVTGVGEMSGWQHPDLEAVSGEQVQAFVRKG